MVRGGDIDVGEIAITTYLLALEFKKPLTGIPVQLWRRLHHGNLVCLNESDIRGPKDLEGKKVGVRAYSQTTGVWIRGILKTQYGVDLDKITWVTMEDAMSPSIRTRRRPFATSAARASGTCCSLANSPRSWANATSTRPTCGRSSRMPSAAAAEWSKRTGLFPVNHVLAVRTDLLKQHPWLHDELVLLLDEARIKSGADGVAAMPYGLEPNRQAMQTLCEFAADQKLTSKVFRLDELFPAG